MMNKLFGKQQQSLIPIVNYGGTGLRRRVGAAMLCLAFVTMGALSVAQRAAAQSAWAKMKQQLLQQACRGGDQGACQQLAKLNQKQSQQQGQPRQSGEQQQPAAQARYQTAAAAPSGGAEPDSGCCTAAAMKAMAAQASASPLNIVGIKLGMTPKQARDAIKAHNPALSIWTVNLRLTHPGAKNFIEVPFAIYASNNPIPESGGRAMQVGAEDIVLQFTLPPNPPVLTYASRYTNFAPALAGNLVNELDKKYGPEYPRPGMRKWVYDSNGKPVTTTSQAVGSCAADMYGPLGRQTPLQGELGHITSITQNIDVNTYKYAKSSVTAPKPECIPYSIVMSSLPAEWGPNTQVMNIGIMMVSGGLNYASARSTDEWLQAEAAALAKAAHDKAAQNPGTTF